MSKTLKLYNVNTVLLLKLTVVGFIHVYYSNR